MVEECDSRKESKKQWGLEAAGCCSQRGSKVRSTTQRRRMVVDSRRLALEKVVRSSMRRWVVDVMTQAVSAGESKWADMDCHKIGT